MSIDAWLVDNCAASETKRCNSNQLIIAVQTTTASRFTNATQISRQVPSAYHRFANQSVMYSWCVAGGVTIQNRNDQSLQGLRSDSECRLIPTKHMAWSVVRYYAFRTDSSINWSIRNVEVKDKWYRNLFI